MESEYITNIDILVSTSISPESFGRTIIESAIFGIPSIVTNIGSPKDFIEEGKFGLLVEPRNSKQIYEKIKILIDNNDLYEQYSKSAILYSKKFNFKFYKKEIKRVFCEDFTIR